MTEYVWFGDVVVEEKTTERYATGTYMYDSGSFYQLTKMEEGYQYDRAWLCVTPKEVPEAFRLALMLLDL